LLFSQLDGSFPVRHCCKIGETRMFSFNNEYQCPRCFTQVTNWAARCPKCGYHPDCCNSPYNRAQDDVALFLRYESSSRSVDEAPQVDGRRWRRFLPAWLGGPSGASARSLTRV
jgi:hypothetical protein